jgi:hypothetical protein
VSAVAKDIEMEQGSTFYWFFQLQHVDLSPVNLTGWGFRMQVRARQQEPIQVGVDTADANPGVILGVDPNDFDATLATPVPSNGWVYIKIGADLTSLINVKTGAYDNELYDPSDATVVYRIFSGSTVEKLNITQETGEPVLT